MALTGRLIDLNLRRRSLLVLAGGLSLMLLAFPAVAQRYYMEPIQISPAQLVEAYQRDFHAADAMYTGKLLLITGRIKTFRPPQRSNYYHYDKLYAYLTLDTGNNRPLAVYFWDWEAQKINFNPNMRNGVTITVMGFCQGVPPQLSLREACVYPQGCGGPTRNFDGPYYEVPPSPQPLFVPVPAAEHLSAGFNFFNLLTRPMGVRSPQDMVPPSPKASIFCLFGVRPDKIFETARSVLVILSNPIYCGYFLLAPTLGRYFGGRE